MALSKKNRLKSEIDFENIFRKGKAVKGSFLFIKGLLNKEGLPRFGLVISKKIFPRAVDRNRLKRSLSETAREFIKNNPTLSKDIIIVVNKKENEKILCLELIELLKNIINV